MAKNRSHRYGILALAAGALLILLAGIGRIHAWIPQEGAAETVSGAGREAAIVAPAMPEEDELAVDIRVYVPNTLSTQDFVGHYDMKINADVTFRGKQFHNPVFSYLSGIGLYVFDESDTGALYGSAAAGDYEDCSAYRWRFIIKDASRLDGLLTAIDGTIIASIDEPSAENAMRCTLSYDNRFFHYNFATANCFYAIAYWMNELGEGRLLEVCRTVDEGRLPNVFPVTIAEQFADEMRLIQ